MVWRATAGVLTVHEVSEHRRARQSRPKAARYALPERRGVADGAVGMHVGAGAEERRWALEKWVEGRPRTLIHNGVLDEKVMREELLTHHELGAALRAAGVAAVEHVSIATLENNGQITVSPRNAAG